MDKWQPNPQAASRKKQAAEPVVRRRVPPEAPAALNGESARSQLLAARWPVLGEAMVAYQQNVAAAFAEEAYFCVEDGLIRMEERQRLAARGKALGLRPFDAELLIACALRDWAADHANRPKIKYAKKAASPMWKLWASAAVAALIMDIVVVVVLFR